MNPHPHRRVVELEVQSGLGFTEPTSQNTRVNSWSLTWFSTHSAGP
jgi:hypothetical protein